MAAQTWNMYNVGTPGLSSGSAAGKPVEDELTPWLKANTPQAQVPSYATPTTWGQGGAQTAGQALYETQKPTTGGGLQYAGTGGGGTGGFLDPNAAYGNPLAGTTTGAQAINNDNPAANETTTEGLQSQTRDALINILNQGMPNETDPMLAPQISAFNAASNRAAQRQIAQNAEAFGAAGLDSSGARLGADQGVLQQQGLSEASFASGLVGKELNARRDQIMDALKVALATTDQDLARRLQKELADIDAAIRNRGLDVQKGLGEADIDLRDKLGTGNLNIALLDALLRDRQFGDKAAIDIAQLEAMLNNSSVAALLAS